MILVLETGKSYYRAINSASGRGLLAVLEHNGGHHVADRGSAPAQVFLPLLREPLMPSWGPIFMALSTLNYF